MAEYVNINTGTINKNVPTKETFDAARPRLVRATLPASYGNRYWKYLYLRKQGNFYC